VVVGKLEFRKSREKEAPWTSGEALEEESDVFLLLPSKMPSSYAVDRSLVVMTHVKRGIPNSTWRNTKEERIVWLRKQDALERAKLLGGRLRSTDIVLGGW
jgi:hypothetical protein